MAIDQISAGEAGQSVRTKMNLAIDEANKVGGKADSAALTAEVNARQQAITTEANARQQGDTSEAQARQHADDAEAQARAAGDKLRVTYAEAASSLIRPGEANRFFTAELDGSSSEVEPLPDDAKAVTGDGSVAVVSGAGNVAPIAVWRVEPGRQFRARFVFRRATDTEDPANDAIRMGLRWLKKDKSGLSTTILADILDVVEGSGRLEYFFNFAMSDADTIDATGPAGAVYVRPFVRAFGSGVTHVEVIEVTDLSGAVEFAPNVSEFRRELAGFDHRLESFTDRVDVAEENIEASRDAAWFTKGTLDDARLSANVMVLDEEQTVTVDKTFAAPLRVRAAFLVGDGQATGGGATARIIGDGNYFAIAPTNKAGSFDTLKELSFNADGDALWTAEGGFRTTGSLAVTVNASIGGTLAVTGIASFANHVGITGALALAGVLNVGGAALFNSTLGVLGAFHASAAATFDDDVAIDGDTGMAGDVDVGGAATFQGSVTAEAGLNVAGTAALADDLTVGGDAAIIGTLEVDGNVTLVGGTMNGVVIGGAVPAAATFTEADFTDPAATRTNLDVYDKAYVDNLIAAQDAMVFKGVIDCSANPNYPAADRGWTYRVSVAG